MLPFSSNTILIYLSLIFTVTISIVVTVDDSPSLKTNSILGTLVNKSVCSNPSAYRFSNRHGTHKYYMLYDLLVTWVEGELLCERYGAHLPMPRNHSDTEYLKWFVGPLIFFQGLAYGAKNPTPGIWLGGYLSATTNTWKWVNGKAITHFEWASGEPNVPDKEFVLGLVYNLQQNKYLGWGDYPQQWTNVAVCELNC